MLHEDLLYHLLSHLPSTHPYRLCLLAHHRLFRRLIRVDFVHRAAVNPLLLLALLFLLPPLAV